MKRELTLFPEPATTIAELQQQVQDTRIHTYVAVRGEGGGILCIDVTVWAPLSVTCVSFDLNLLSYTPTMINYQLHQFLIQ